MIAITEAFPDGQRVTGVAMEYNEPVRNADVRPEAFRVKGGTVTGAYTNTEARPASEPKDGRFVIVKLKLDDEDSKTGIHTKPARRPGGPVLGIQYGLEGPLIRDDFTVNEEGIQQILDVLDHVLNTCSIDRNRPDESGANAMSNHMSTWPVVYGIDALRDWLFTQKKEG